MEELKEQLKTKEFQKCYLFYGTEKYLMKQYENVFVKNILTEQEQEMNLDIIDGNNKVVQALDLMNIVETYPFFASKRLVVVYNSGFFSSAGSKDDIEEFIELIKDLPETSCMIFCEDVVEKSNELFKVVSELHKVVEFKPAKELELKGWIKKEVKNQGCYIENHTIAYFLRNINNDMSQIANEIAKLTSYKPQNNEITIEDINNICSLTLESNIFELMNFVTSGNSAEANALYKNLLVRKESPFAIMGLITSQYRTILISSLLNEEGYSVHDIVKSLEVKSDYPIKKALALKNKYTIKTLSNIMELILETDFKIKSGVIKDELAVELLIISLCNNSINSVQ